jgi:hypothetical protein
LTARAQKLVGFFFRFFIALAVETLLPASGNRSNYSHDFFVDTPCNSRYIVYLRHAAIFVLEDASAASMWRPSEGDRCSGRWYGASIEQQALGACVESFQGHVISLSLHGWHAI